MSKNCSNCNSINDDNAKFCSKCGQQFQELNICPNCKKRVEDNVKFCPYCGNSMSVGSNGGNPIIRIKRDFSFIGCVVKYKLKIDDKEYNIKMNDDFTVSVPPGNHTIAYYNFTLYKWFQDIKMLSNGDILLIDCTLREVFNNEPVITWL